MPDLIPGPAPARGSRRRFAGSVTHGFWLPALPEDKVSSRDGCAARHMRLVLAALLLAIAGAELVFGAAESRLPYGALAAGALLALTVIIDRFRAMPTARTRDEPS
jgi:hypothetical protein